MIDQIEFQIAIFLGSFAPSFHLFICQKPLIKVFTAHSINRKWNIAGFLKYFPTVTCIPHICCKYHKSDLWRKICHVEKFQIYMHERCGEIWNFSTCGVISNFSTWQMWRNLKFLHSWHVYDVENVFKCVHVMLFCWKIGFVVISAVCREICFDAICALLCGKN